MTPDTEHDLDRLAADWQAVHAPGPAPDAIQRYVRSRTRALRVWASGELLVGAVALGALITLAITTANPSDRLAMISLAIVVIASGAVSWLNWRGLMHATVRSTSEFVELSLLRLRRMRRAYAAGWVLLGAEVAVLSTWIVHRSFSGDVRSAVFSWGLLACMTALAVVFLFGFRRWIARDERHLVELRREFEE